VQVTLSPAVPLIQHNNNPHVDHHNVAHTMTTGPVANLNSRFEIHNTVGQATHPSLPVAQAWTCGLTELVTHPTSNLPVYYFFEAPHTVCIALCSQTL